MATKAGISVEVESVGEVDNERIATALTEKIEELSERANVELNDIEKKVEVYCGFEPREFEPPAVILSNPSNYLERMSEIHTDPEAFEMMERNPDLPLPEIIESSAHLVAGFAVGGRANPDDKVGVALDEFLAGLGMEETCPELLENDSGIIGRNLRLQKEMYSEYHRDWIRQEREGIKRGHSEVLNSWLENDPRESAEISTEYVETYMDSIPETLEDYPKFTRSESEHPGTLSEFVIRNVFFSTSEQYDDGNFSRSAAENHLESSYQTLSLMESMGIDAFADSVLEEATKRDRAYYAGRQLAKEEGGIAEYYHMSNEELRDRQGDKITDKLEEAREEVGLSEDYG